MKKRTYNSALILLLFLFGSCSYKVNRMGYKASEEMVESNPQKVIFQKVSDLDSVNFTKVGSVELKDNGFTSNCHEDDALKQLEIEAFYAGGHLVNIIEEERTSVQSTCYRCKAEIYRIESDSLLQSMNSDSLYAQKHLQERVTADRKKNNGGMAGAIVGGILGGILGAWLAASMF